MKRVVMLALVVNGLSVLNAIVFLPLMLGTGVRHWGWAVAYFAGFVVVGTGSFGLQHLMNAASRKRLNERFASEATVSVSVAE